MVIVDTVLHLIHTPVVSGVVVAQCSSGEVVSPSLEAELSVSLPSYPYHLSPAVKKSLCT